jgi:sulfotransferase family protein
MAPTEVEHRYRRPILVTGAPRTGTTWVGRMLDRSSEVGYINEPFNPTHQRGIFACGFPHWYQYLGGDESPSCASALSETLSFRYALRAQLSSGWDRSVLETLIRDGWNFAVSRVRRARPLVKDPIAVFSSDWFARTYGADVVFMVRHPAPFAASVKRLGWTFPFADLLAQGSLMNDHLAGFETELRAATRDPDPVTHAALMWRLVYTVARTFEPAHPSWLFLRHEDLARDPSKGFADLFGRLGLSYTPKIDDTVRWFANGPIEEEDGAAEQAIRRHSTDTTERWKQRLTLDERARIRSSCEPLAIVFYPDAEW